MPPHRAHAFRRAAALLALTLGIAVATTPAAQGLERVPGTPTRVESLTFDQSAMTLTRGALAEVTVSAHLVDPDPAGVVPAQEGV